MKSLTKLAIAITVLLSVTVSNAQIKNAKTETVKIFGNCGMCETTIEKAGNLKKIAKVDWDKDTKMATLTYDTTKTTQEEILKRIAIAGYDSEKFLAPDEAYNNLHGCCQYDREAKIASKTDTKSEAVAVNHSNHTNHSETIKAESQGVNQLKPVFDNYFALKDALVKTDGTNASAKAKELLTAINAVKMEKLQSEEHMVWMKVLTGLKEHAQHISETKDITKQRDYFKDLSKNMYDLMKVAKYETPVFYQFCPMADDGKGANWLSKENAVKNPYFGSMMMSCGKTVETIK